MCPYMFVGRSSEGAEFCGHGGFRGFICVYAVCFDLVQLVGGVGCRGASEDSVPGGLWVSSGTATSKIPCSQLLSACI